LKGRNEDTKSIFLITGVMPLAGYMWCGSLEFLIPVCVAALIFVLAEAVL
jgi:hypothetical protein